MTGGVDMGNADLLLTTTRAVRKRLDLQRPVALTTILECLDVAVQAPTGGNLQAWRWLVVRDADRKEQLADLYRAAYAQYVVGRDETDPSTAAIRTSADHLAERLHDVPALVIPCLLGRLEEHTTEAAAGFYGSVLPAVWSFMLALRSRGLGSAYTTLHLRYEHEAAAILGVPPTVTQVALIPVAHTRGTGFRPAPRRPAREVTYLEQWGTKPGHEAREGGT